MKKICSITFANGVKFEATENGYTVISIQKDKTMFDSSGKLIRVVEGGKNEKADTSWLEYFVKIAEIERDIVKKYLENLHAKTTLQSDFLKIVNEGLLKLNYDYQIATIEPSIDIKGKIYYKKGIKPCVGLDNYIWVKKAKEFSKEYKSELATVYELFIYYAYLIARGYTTIEHICDEFCDEEKHLQKVVTSEKGIVWCGGDNKTYSEYQTIADTYYPKEDEQTNENGIGVVVLKKIN